MFVRCLLNALEDGRLKGCKIRIVLGVETLFFYKAPEALNEIEVG